MRSAAPPLPPGLTRSPEFDPCHQSLTVDGQRKCCIRWRDLSPQGRRGRRGRGGRRGGTSEREDISSTMTTCGLWFSTASRIRSCCRLSTCRPVVPKPLHQAMSRGAPTRALAQLLGCVHQRLLPVLHDRPLPGPCINVAPDRPAG